MNQTWDLSVLYKDFDDPAYAADMAALDAAIAALHKLAEEAGTLSASELTHRYADAGDAFVALESKLYIYASLRYSADTGNTAAASTVGRVMDKASAAVADDTRIREAIAAIGHDRLEELLSADPTLSEYAYLFRSILKDSRYRLSDREEALIAKMNLSGADAWENLQSSLTSSVKVLYRGQTITLSDVRNLAYDADPAVRRDAYDAEIACYEPIRDAVAFAMNSLKLQTINECALRGFSSPLDQALHASRMKRETLDALLSAMQEYLPVFWKYLRAKSAYLGHDGALPWWDMFAPIGKSDAVFTTESARDYLLQVFSGFDSQLHDMVERAFNEAWIDFFPRSGKVGGAFDCGIPAVRQSRVLTNFAGSFSDVVTLAHELGHAFHDQQVFPHPAMVQDYTMPVAETASTFNEVLVGAAAIAAAPDTETELGLLEAQLSDATQIICDIYSRFLFEDSVFAHRSEEFMNANRLCELMLEAQKTAYGDGLDPATLHPYMWLCKSHYYGMSYYIFPYAFGGLFARGLYAEYRRRGAEFVPVYKQMLAATTHTDVEECARIAGIDLTDKAFWEAGLSSLAEQIERFCTLAAAHGKEV